MFAQRSTQQALRRFAASRPSMIQQMAGKNVAAPLAIMSANQMRPATTQTLITPADSYKILVEQRKLRPNSPHLTIYQPQITWYASITHRITGSVLSGAFYIFGSAYLISPLVGWHLDSASMAAAFAAWPVAAKVATKFAFAWPFTFHFFNGFRHLAWDMGKTMTNKAIAQTGWFVTGISVLSALYLSAFV